MPSLTVQPFQAQILVIHVAQHSEAALSLFMRLFVDAIDQEVAEPRDNDAGERGGEHITLAVCCRLGNIPIVIIVIRSSRSSK
jgi:hypothetical protein